MTKRQTIDEILSLNRTAAPEFLAEFDVEDLEAYLRRLTPAEPPVVQTPAAEPSPVESQRPAKRAITVPVVRDDEDRQGDAARAVEEPADAETPLFRRRPSCRVAATVG